MEVLDDFFAYGIQLIVVFYGLLSKKLKRFEQVLLQDGASFALHPDLAEMFPNRFKGHSPADVECYMTMSQADAQPIKVAFRPTWLQSVTIYPKQNK